MNKNKNSFKKLSVSIGIGVLMGISATQAVAQNQAPAQGQNPQTPQIMLPEYTAQQLKEARCDPNVWNELVQNYLAKRGYERQVQGKIQVIDQGNAAPQANQGASGASCWDQAIDQLGSIATTLDSIMSIFNGGFSASKLGGIIKQQVSDFACSQVLNYTNQISYGVNSTVNGVYQDTIGKIGYNNGVINVGAQDILKNPAGTGTGAISGAYGQATSGIRQGGNALGQAASGAVDSITNKPSYSIDAFK